MVLPENQSRVPSSMDFLFTMEQWPPAFFLPLSFLAENALSQRKSNCCKKKKEEYGPEVSSIHSIEPFQNTVRRGRGWLERKEKSCMRKGKNEAESKKIFGKERKS